MFKLSIRENKPATIKNLLKQTNNVFYYQRKNNKGLKFYRQIIWIKNKTSVF